MVQQMARLQEDLHARLVEQSGVLRDDFRVRLISEISRVESTFAARLGCETSRLEEELTQRFSGESARIAESLRSEVARIDKLLGEGAEEVKDAVARLREEARKRLPEPLGQEQLRSLSDEFPQRLDGLYLSFEDVFRGSRADIQRSLEVYLPYLSEAQAGEESRPILDLGCGRGEWLELLQERHLRARGVDWNRAMVADCQSRQLDVEQGDLLEYLRSAPATSLGAVTGFHIVEHLLFDKLIEVLDEVTRALKPGGVAIFETPNPENILVGACQFYIDPTHRRPIPAPTLQFLVEARGLCHVQVVFLHPCPEFNEAQGRQDELAANFNRYFYGPQDYTVIARKV
jgi:O-antigen chain-terminating methyltransferase